METIWVRLDPCPATHLKDLVKFLARSEPKRIKDGPRLLCMDMNERSPLSAAFAEQMRAERGALGISKPALAKRTGISHSTIKRLEANEREMNTDHLDRICRAFGISITEFVTRADARRTDAKEEPGDAPEASGV